MAAMPLLAIRRLRSGERYAQSRRSICAALMAAMRWH